MAQYTGHMASLALAHGSAFVAVAYWCDDAWAICSGSNRAEVEKAADIYLEMWPGEYNAAGNFVNGHGAEGYWIMEVPALLPNVGGQPRAELGLSKSKPQ